MLNKQVNKNKPTTTELKDLPSGQIGVVYFLPVVADRFRVVCRKYPFPSCYTKNATLELRLIRMSLTVREKIY